MKGKSKWHIINGFVNMRRSRRYTAQFPFYLSEFELSTKRKKKFIEFSLFIKNKAVCRWTPHEVEGDLETFLMLLPKKVGAQITASCEKNFKFAGHFPKEAVIESM